MSDRRQLVFDFAVPASSALDAFVRDLKELKKAGSGSKQKSKKSARSVQWPTEGVIQGDCVEGMQTLPEDCIDLVFADPPFNIGYDYDEYDDRQQADDYLNWCETWMREVHRVLKPNGSFWLAIGDDYVAELKVIAQRSVGFVPRSWVIWYYTFGVNCKRKFTRSHTHLLYFTKDPSEFTFNQDDPAIRIPSARQLVYGDRRANPKGRLPDDTWILRPQDLEQGFCAEEDTWYFPRVAGTFKQRAGFHGCQMPEQLLARIVRSCSSEGQWVMDPFAGSGTTLLVSKKLNRHSLGFELSKSYATEVAKRWKTVQVGDPLEGAEDPLTSAPSTADGRKLEKKPAKVSKEKGAKTTAKGRLKKAKPESSDQ